MSLLLTYSFWFIWSFFTVCRVSRSSLPYMCLLFIYRSLNINKWKHFHPKLFLIPLPYLVIVSGSYFLLIVAPVPCFPQFSLNHLIGSSCSLVFKWNLSLVELQYSFSSLLCPRLRPVTYGSLLCAVRGGISLLEIVVVFLLRSVSVEKHQDAQDTETCLDFYSALPNTMCWWFSTLVLSPLLIANTLVCYSVVFTCSVLVHD